MMFLLAIAVHPYSALSEIMALPWQCVWFAKEQFASHIWTTDNEMQYPFGEEKLSLHLHNSLKSACYGCTSLARWSLLLDKHIWTSPSPLVLCSFNNILPWGWSMTHLGCLCFSHSITSCAAMPGCWISHRLSSIWGFWLVPSPWATLQTGTVLVVLSFDLFEGENTCSVICNKHATMLWKFNSLWITLSAWVIKTQAK